MSDRVPEQSQSEFETKLQTLREQREQREQRRAELLRRRQAAREKAIRDRREAARLRREAARESSKAISSLARSELLPLLMMVNRVYLNETGTIVMSPNALRQRVRLMAGKTIDCVLLILIWGTIPNREENRVTGYKLVLRVESSTLLRVENHRFDMAEDGWRDEVQEYICDLLANPRRCYIEQSLA